MIEWQNENSLLSLKVIGRQWFWEYRYDSDNLTRVEAASRECGNNKVGFSRPRESLSEDIIQQEMELLRQNESILDFQREARLDMEDKIEEERAKQPQPIDIGLDYIVPRLEYNFPLHPNLVGINVDDDFLAKSTGDLNDVQRLRRHKYVHYTCFSHYKEVLGSDAYNYDSLQAISTKRKALTIYNIELNQHFCDIIRCTPDDAPELQQPILFIFKFWTKGGAPEDKLETRNLFWGFRQKKWKKINKLSELTAENFSIPVENEFAVNPDDGKEHDYVHLIRFNRFRPENVPIALARRLLRVKRVLVLPTHVNVSILTNSYDVVHSWFIPALATKLDCVPGRSTHHLIYIDSIGLFYGQCAEICGRYHHHMPITVCSLPYDHFLIWWQRRAVTRLTRMSNEEELHEHLKDMRDYANFKYRW